jgi:predicted O-linked N-acetylglucosamine transferase (SPINDLY family)
MNNVDLASFERASALHRAGNLAQAQVLYRQFLAMAPDHAGALHMLGMSEVQAGQVALGIGLIERSISLDPAQPQAHSTLGNALRLLRRPADALQSFDRALALDPAHVPALNNRAITLLDLGRPLEALACCEQVLRLKPAHAGARVNRAAALLRLARPAEALQDLDRVLEAQPGFAAALVARGRALLGLGRPEEAIDSLDRARQLGGDNAMLWTARAQALVALRRLEEAVASFDQALLAEPLLVDVHSERAAALMEMHCPSEALASYERLLGIDPSLAAGHFNSGIALAMLGRYALATACFAKTLELAPDFPDALGALLQANVMQCDWTDWEQLTARTVAQVVEGRRTITPFALLAVDDSPALHLQCARLHVSDHFPSPSGIQPPVCWPGEPRIRVGYLSGDFRDHPVAQLLAGVLAHHDRERFEPMAIALRPPDDSEFAARIRASVGSMVDVSRESDAAASERIRRLGVDILIDLQGLTVGARPGILARRAAAVQVNYLGFPSTMGADFVDGFIGDHITIPDGAEADYAERVLRLPHCFMPFDNRQQISAEPLTRAAIGLPQSGFVFCAVNNPYKFTPFVFDAWMRLLRQTPGSVLWLRAAPREVEDNLRNEAKRRGVDQDRLLFLARVAHFEDYLARLRLADLFLDTFPYNAHATAANALWAGLPVVTSPGRCFASRVGASLLHAVGLPELVADGLEGYEQLALALAHDAGLLAQRRAALAGRRNSCALFDTARYCRDFEDGLSQLLQHAGAGASHDPIDVGVSR